VEWLIITWTSAIAAAPPTLGASTAAAGAATAAEGAVTTSRAVLFMQRAVQLFQRLSTLLTTVRTGMIARAAAEFVPVAGEAPISLWQAEKNLLTAWDTVVGSATPIGAAQHGAVTDVVTGTAPRLTDDEQDRGLDPSR
jgi:hypothetical protein